MTNLTLAAAGASFARVGKWILGRLEERSTYLGLAAVALSLDHGEIATKLTALGTSGPLVIGALGVVLAAATTKNPTAIATSLPGLDIAAEAALRDAGAPVPEHIHGLIVSIDKLLATLSEAAPPVVTTTVIAPVPALAGSPTIITAAPEVLAPTIVTPPPAQETIA